MSKTSLRFALRERTSQSHEELDRLVGGFGSKGDYQAYLVAIYRYRAQAESELAAAHWPTALGSWRPQTVAAELRSDLADLALTAPEIEDQANRPLGESELVGRCYVLEGSALGARILYKRAQALGFGSDFGARHLAKQSNDLDNWRHFIGVLDTYEFLDLERAVGAANDSFRTAAQAFARFE